jgi:trimethylamine---corrinoid protein Co-methyltransferase
VTVPKVCLKYMSDADVQFVHAQTLRVLEQVGVAYNTPEAIELLAAAGATVDRERLTARLPWTLIEECLRGVSRTVRLDARDPQRAVTVGDGSLLCACDGSGVYLLDDRTGERREGTADDTARILRLYDALPEIDFCWYSLAPMDFDPRTTNLDVIALCYRNTTKHLMDEVRRPEYAAPIIEIAEAVGGASLHDRPVFSVINCTVAPLQHDGEMTEAGIRMARAGAPIMVLPMPAMGTTGPMSPLGCAIISMAEILSALVVYQLAAPGSPFIAGVAAGAADMRSGLFLAGTVEMALIQAITTKMNHHYGLSTMVQGPTTDAKAADFQSGAEDTFTALAGALAGADGYCGAGVLDGAQTVSPARAVLDNDLQGMIKRFVRGGAFDEAAALVDDIVDVGIGGHYLARRSTRAGRRSGELWEPSIFRRGTADSYAGRTLKEEATERAEHLMATHEVPPLPDDVERHIAEVIASFRATL